jgi:hypothetical protein
MPSARDCSSPALLASTSATSPPLPGPQLTHPAGSMQLVLIILQQWSSSVSSAANWNQSCVLTNPSSSVLPNDHHLDTSFRM